MTPFLVISVDGLFYLWILSQGCLHFDGFDVKKLFIYQKGSHVPVADLHGKFLYAAPCLFWPNFHFHVVLRKFGQIIAWCPLFGLGAPPWEILDPPLSTNTCPCQQIQEIDRHISCFTCYKINVIVVRL